MTTPIRSLTPFDHPDEWARLMATLPETSLLALMDAKARTRDVPWLRTMLDGGLLLIDEDLRCLDYDGLDDALADWCRRTEPFVANLCDISAAIIDSDNVFGKLDREIAVPVLNFDERYRSLVRDACCLVREEYASLAAMPLVTDLVAVHGHKALAHMLFAAVAADLPTEVAALTRACPAAAQELLDLHRLGPPMMEATTIRHANAHTKIGAGAQVPRPTGGNFQVTPVFLAIALSRVACLHALYDAGAQPTDRLAIVGKQRQGQVGQEMFVPEYRKSFHMLCTPETLQAVYGRYLSAPGVSGSAEAADLFKDCLEVMDPAHRNTSYPAYLPAFTGVFQEDARRAVTNAAANAYPTVVHALATAVDWRQFAGQFEDAWKSPILHAAHSHKLLPIAARSEDGWLALLHCAEEAGFLPAFLKTFASQDMQNATTLGPVYDLAVADMPKTMLRYLPYIDARATPDGGVSLLKALERDAPAAANMIRAQLALASANVLIENIEKQPISGPKGSS